MSIGDRIKECRLKLGLSVDEVAEKLGKNRATIYRYEGGGITNLPTTVLEPLSQILETTPEYLMGWTKIKPSSILRDSNKVSKLIPKQDSDINELDQEIKLLARSMQKLTPNKRKKLHTALELLFEEEFKE